jgi:hypothetical protein
MLEGERQLHAVRGRLGVGGEKLTAPLEVSAIRSPPAVSVTSAPA